MHRSFKFCLLTLAGLEERVESAEFAFFLHHPDDLARDNARFALTPDELLLLNPNTGTCPVFRSRRDAEITLSIYKRHPILIRDGDDSSEANPWGLSFMTMFHMSNDSGLFHARDQLEAEGWVLSGNSFERNGERMLPLYEAKMVHHFDHRWATYEGEHTRDLTAAEHDDPDVVALPRYWVAEPEVDSRLKGRTNNKSLIGFRNVCRATDERSMLIGAMPRTAVGHSSPLLFAGRNLELLAAAMTSVAFDYVCRQKLGGINLTYFIVEQLPVPAPRHFETTDSWSGAPTTAGWIGDRFLELTYTAWDIAPFASDLGDAGPPFRWDMGRRAQLRAELDAGFFHLYGLDREDTEYVLGTFPIANRKDPELAERILAAYDAMTTAIETGVPFNSPLEPAPGHGPRHPDVQEAVC